MSEVTTMPVGETVERKSKIEEVFDQNFIELLRLVPRNPLVRALILKQTGKMPESECGTYEQIREWVEVNCEKRARPSPKGRNRGTANQGITIDVEFTDVEYGQASYSMHRSGSGEFHVSAEELVEIIQEAIESGGGMEEIMDVVAQKIEDDAWEYCDPDMDDSGEFDYDNHESNDHDNNEVDFTRGDIRNAVLAFVRDRHPELAGEL
jgi:hypothetical protein